ncbi:MAG: class I SAM-dependent methyltransferase [Leptospirillum sp.]
MRNVKFQGISVTEQRADNQFDVVFSNSAFHWINDPEAPIQSIHPCLRSEGRIGFQFTILDSSHPLRALTRKASTLFNWEDAILHGNSLGSFQNPHTHTLVCCVMPLGSSQRARDPLYI